MLGVARYILTKFQMKIRALGLLLELTKMQKRHNRSPLKARYRPTCVRLAYFVPRKYRQASKTKRMVRQRRNNHPFFNRYCRPRPKLRLDSTAVNEHSLSHP